MKLMPADGGMLWVAWPKKAAKMETDLDENIIRTMMAEIDLQLAFSGLTSIGSVDRSLLA